MGASLRLLSSAVGLISAIAITFLSEATSIQAAQTVIIRRGSSTETFSVADLRTLAETGKASPAVQRYARTLSAEQQSQVVAALKTRFDLNALEVRNLLDTAIGNELVSAVASVTPRTDEVGKLNVKTGLVLGARAPEGLSIVNFIEAYPRPTLEIDLQRSFAVLQNFNTAFWQTQAFMTAISPQLTDQRPQLNLPFDPTQPGTANVQLLQNTFNDPQRRRTIPVDIYWSEASTANKPMIIFSHGLGSVRTDMRYLAEHLASHGYIVAALEHPGSNESHVRNAVAGKEPILEPQEFLNRPKDITFVIDQLTQLNQTDKALRGKLASQVMVIGYSLGGSTALSVAGAELQLTGLKQRCQGSLLSFSLGEAAQCFASQLPEDRYQLRDPRVKGVMALSPTTSMLFGETGLASIAVPTLIESASADKTTPALTEQVVGFMKIPQPKWLVGIVGATHLSVKDPSTTEDQAEQPNTLYSGGEVVGEQAVAIRNYIKALSLAMAAQLTDEADQFKIFLTPEYAQLASTNAFPIRLVTEIPAEAAAVVKEFTQNSAAAN